MPDLNAMIAVQSRGGMQFGYVRSADEERVSFEVEAPILPGEEVDWRMQLIGLPETAMGRCVIEQIADQPGRWPLFHARITFMTDPDRALYRGWLKDFAEGGTSRRLERKGGEIEQGLLSGMRTQTTAVHKIALERMAQRDALRRAIRKKGSAPGADPDSFGLAQESTPSGAWSAEVGRKAVKDALKEVTRSPARLAGPPAEAPPPAAPVDGPAPVTAEPAAPAAPAEDPLVTVDLAARPPRVSVRWTGAATFRAAFARHLKAGALVVPAPGLDRSGLTVEIALAPPGGAEVSCPAQVSAVLPDGVGFALLLSAAQRRALAEAAQG